MSDVDYVLIGKRIKETRKKMHASQAELAEMTGLSVPYISNIETAYKKASLSSLVSIANAAGISVDELLYGNLNKSDKDYHIDAEILIGSCNRSEKRFVFLLVEAVISILRDNGWLLGKHGSEDTL